MEPLVVGGVFFWLIFVGFVQKLMAMRNVPNYNIYSI